MEFLCNAPSKSDDENNCIFTHLRLKEPHRNLSKHMHTQHELILILEKEVPYVVENHEYLLQPYSLLIIPSTAYHFAKIEQSDLYSRYMLLFPRGFFDQELEREIFSKPACYKLHKNDHIVHAFESLNYFNETNLSQYKDAMMKSVGTEIVLQLLSLKRQLRPQEEATQAAFPFPLFEYIDDHLTEIKSIEEIAQHFFLSESSLMHQFKNNMKISLMKFIKQKRLFLAQAMLKEGKKPMEVFETCGFHDYPTFFRSYVKQFGYSPSKTK